MSIPELSIFASSEWEDYELLDSGNGSKLERFGSYIFERPEHQAVWKRLLPTHQWEKAHAIFRPSGEESGGNWEFRKPIPSSWNMKYGDLTFEAATSHSRHLGVFPEQAVHWDWMSKLIQKHTHPIKVLNLFGYTGIASLSAAHAGATVTHVDASKKTITWAKRNQELSNLTSRPIRWLIDDAEKFVRREVRRGTKYEGLILDPPKFGRGPEGQVWDFFEALPDLLRNCRLLLSQRPLFIILTAYAIRASSLSLHYALEETCSGLRGHIFTGELALIEKSGGRYLSTAITSRWCSIDS
jgi:23S rRNA (cytosine1962-C5)-methyltransferase